MKKSEKIRNALQQLGVGDDIDAAGLGQATGIKNVVVSLASMVKSGEVIASGDRGSMRYRLNPGHKPSRQSKLDKTLPVKRPRKARKTTRRKRAGKGGHGTTIKDIRRRVKQRAAGNTALRAALIDNTIAAAAFLADIVEANVEGIEDSPILKGALDSYRRAAALKEAA